MTEASYTPSGRSKKSSNKLRRELVVPAALDQVFSFFSDAHNLDRITPPFLRFRVLTLGPIVMQAGTRIDYALRLHGIPLRWTSEITVWEPPHRFVDVQIRGPYRWWHHEHQFDDLGASTRIVDEVEYACPGGRLVHELFVKRDLARIFDYRTQVLARPGLFTTSRRPADRPGAPASKRKTVPEEPS